MPRISSIVSTFLLILFILHVGMGISIAEPSSEPDRIGANSGTSPYKVGPSDILTIYVWKEKELTQDAMVMPDGRVHLPLLGEVMAQGRTVTDLKEEIAKGYDKFVTAPEVTVIVKEIRSRRVYIIGKVSKPGPYPLEPDMTVLQALSTAGGFTEWADTKSILIVRRGAGKQFQIPFNYKELVDGKRVEQNILLEPNDTIVVP